MARLNGEPAGNAGEPDAGTMTGLRKKMRLFIYSLQTFLDRIVTMNLAGWRVVRAPAQYDRRFL
jgi:hypothetical protein